MNVQLLISDTFTCLYLHVRLSTLRYLNASSFCQFVRIYLRSVGLVRLTTSATPQADGNTCATHVNFNRIAQTDE